MARKAQTTDAPTGKRQKGFAVVIKGFIPMGESIEAQIATLNVIKELEAGDLSGIKDWVGVEVVSKQTSRVVASE